MFASQHAIGVILFITQS